MAERHVANECLRRMVEQCEGALAAVLLDDRGAELATSGSGKPFDPDVFAEQSTLLVTEVRKVAKILGFGRLREMVINSAELTFVVRALARGRYLGLAISSEGNMGKARFLARTAWRRLPAL